MLPAQKTPTHHAKNKRGKARKPQQTMVPIHIKITEEMHDLLGEVAKKHGFPRIQGLIRLYIRQGLEAEDVGYSLAEDERFLQKLRRQGVNEAILAAALEDHDSHAEALDAASDSANDKNAEAATLAKIAAELTEAEAALVAPAPTLDTPHPDLIIR